jgi:hypothetical protein
MLKIGTAHQPNYLPWIGLFSKIKQSHCFVLADTFALGDKSTFNRNKIRTNTGWGYLTVPIGRKLNGARLCDVMLPTDRSWQNIHWQTIARNYARSEYFKDYKEFFEELYHRDFKFLWEINQEIILFLIKIFKIKVEVYKASDFGINPEIDTTDFIINILVRAGANTYLSGPSGRNYLDIEKFPQRNMGLKYFKFEHPVYKQRYPGFEPNLSAVDLLFNMGPSAAQIIKESGCIEV